MSGARIRQYYHAERAIHSYSAPLKDSSLPFYSPSYKFNNLYIDVTPYSRIPLQACLLPVKRWGNFMGRMTASFRASFAPSRPATSLHLMFGFSIIIAPGHKTETTVQYLFKSSTGLSPWRSAVIRAPTGTKFYWKCWIFHYFVIRS